MEQRTTSERHVCMCAEYEPRTVPAGLPAHPAIWLRLVLGLAYLLSKLSSNLLSCIPRSRDTHVPSCHRLPLRLSVQLELEGGVPLWQHHLCNGPSGCGVIPTSLHPQSPRLAAMIITHTKYVREMQKTFSRDSCFILPHNVPCEAAHPEDQP